MWPSDTLPTGSWLLCDGSSYSYTAQGGKYKALYDVIGTTFGEGSEGSSFKVPDLRQKFVEGASSDTGHTLGSYVAAGLPDHTHTFSGSSVTSGGNGKHTHTRGSLNLNGKFSANFANLQGKWITPYWTGGEGCFSTPST